jgi:hypothetical protein
VSRKIIEIQRLSRALSRIINLVTDALNALQTTISSETAARETADAAQIPRSISPTLLTSAEIAQNALGVNIDVAYVLPSSGVTGSQSTNLPVASDVLAGLIPAESMAALNKAVSDIESLRSVGGRQIASFATKAALDSYVFAEHDANGDYAIVRDDETQNGATTKYGVSEDADGYLVWIFDMVMTAAPVPFADQATAGIVRGIDANGKIYVESDHTMTLVGYNAIQTTLNNLQSALSTASQELARKAALSDLKTLAYKDSVGTAQIDAAAVATAKIADNAVTPAKLQYTGAFTMGSLTVTTLNITGG